MKEKVNKILLNEYIINSSDLLEITNSSEFLNMIKNVDINLYPTMSPFTISLLNTSSAIDKNPIKQINNIIHFKFFTINSFTFSFIIIFPSSFR